MPNRWYAVRLKSNREQQARQYLEGRAVECYLPVYRTASTRSDRNVQLERPLFPGYLFVRIGIPGPERMEVLRCPGVSGFIQFGDSPAPIEDRTIESLQILTGASRDQVNPHPLIRAGRPVRVIAGPFKGASGVVQESNGKETALVVEVTLLGRAVSVPVEPGQVSPDVEARPGR